LLDTGKLIRLRHSASTKSFGFARSMRITLDGKHLRPIKKRKGGKPKKYE